MAMLYLEIKNDLEHFLNFGTGGLKNSSTGIINKAVRYIQDYYQGTWSYLRITDATATIDSTGTLITLPSDLNNLHYVAKLSRGRMQYRRNTDYVIKSVSPSDLLTSPTRQIKFWFSQTPGDTFYLTYWRYLKEFADTTVEQYPDMPNSGDVIWKTARYLGLTEDEGASVNDIEYWKRQAIESIRDLKCVDNGYDIEETAPIVDVDFDPHTAINYNMLDGGTEKDGYNPVKPVLGE